MSLLSSMNETPRGERLHIGIFGRQSVGKSSLLNAITGQDAAVVSPVKGTTTDPVIKSMELLPIGPVALIDTAGFDDFSELGELRLQKTKNVIRKTDIALLVADANVGLTDEDEELLKVFKQNGVRYLVVYNKADLIAEKGDTGLPDATIPLLKSSPENADATDANAIDLSHDRKGNALYVSAVTGKNIHELKEKIAEVCALETKSRRLVADLISPNDVVVLVVPIDKAAPKGRLILPQQQAIRDILDFGAISVVTREKELEDTLKKLKDSPKLIITDSQVFEYVSKIVHKDIWLTSFSILMARYKGVLDSAVRGAIMLDEIRDGDKILIAEGCTHHRQCDDIGTVKLPKWIEAHTGSKPEYAFSSGGGFPEDLSEFKLIIHCGGCMLGDREMLSRQRMADAAGVPMTNFGVAISHMQSILQRCIAPMLEGDA